MNVNAIEQKGTLTLLDKSGARQTCYTKTSIYLQFIHTSRTFRQEHDLSELLS